MLQNVCSIHVQDSSKIVEPLRGSALRDILAIYRIHAQAYNSQACSSTIRTLLLPCLLRWRKVVHQVDHRLPGSRYEV
jgi:hypothetical protein